MVEVLRFNKADIPSNESLIRTEKLNKLVGHIARQRLGKHEIDSPLLIQSHATALNDTRDLIEIRAKVVGSLR